MIKEIKKDGASLTVYEDSFNKRIRIDDYAGPLPMVLNLIRQEIPGWAEKLIVKSKGEDQVFFISQGLGSEGFIRGYFSGSDMYFMTMYFFAGRETSKRWHEEQLMLGTILGSPRDNKNEVPGELNVASHEEAGELAEFYATIFRIYPTPLGNPDHVKKTMEDGTIYLHIREQGRIVSAASAEINRTFMNAELTDCASLSQVQGKGHIKSLLSRLEQILVKQGITCLYTLARAESYGMNKAFYQLGYTYGGRLINNCLIYSGLEDMNVWYKL